MRTYDETAAALGNPASLLVMDDWDARKLVVARWSRHGAHVVRSDADALRVAVHLGRPSMLRYIQSDVDISLSRGAGDTSVVPPGPANEAIVEGFIDVMQVFVDARSVGPLGEHRSEARPFFKLADDDLMASAVGLVLAAGGMTPGEQPQAASAKFRRVLLEFLASRAAIGAAPRKGGLNPTALHRIEAIIDAWLKDPGSRLPSVIALADEARLSPNHFVRAFREATGATPYQYLMARRRRRAMALLRCPDLSVAEVSDRLGFSSPAHFIASFRQRFEITPGDTGMLSSIQRFSDLVCRADGYRPPPSRSAPRTRRR